MRKIRVGVHQETRLLKSLVLVALVACCHTVISQDLFHSPYSVYGLGIMNDRTSSLNRGLAGSGIAVQDDYNMNHVNPASYVSIAFPLTHSFEVGTYVEYNRYQTNRLYESSINGGLSNLSYWFRIKPWYASAVGLSPFSSVSYNITTQRAIAIGQEGTYVFKGDGNMTRLFWGNGFRVAKNLSLGATVSFIFGSIKRNETILSQSASDILTLENKMFSNKFQMDFGLQYKVNLFARTLSFGATYSGDVSLQGKSSFTLTDLNYDTLANYKGSKVEYEVPEKFGVGISLKSKRSVIASDFTFSRWSTANNPDEGTAFRDSWKASFGYAYQGNEYAENYWGLIGFRAGFYFQDHYLILKDTPLTNWGATFGLMLPVSDGRSLVNITYAYDRMGTVENNLILHTATKIQLDIVIRDVWGQKRRFD